MVRCLFVYSALALLALSSFSLVSCASKFYGKDGRPIATVPWPQKGSMSVDGTTISAEPGAGTVDAATTVALQLAVKSPEIAGKVVEAFAAKVPAEK